jgi:O-antigen ligase
MWGEATTQHSLTGRGVGTPWTYPALYHSPFHYGDAREGLEPHNSYLNILNRYGLFGAGLFFALLLIVAWSVWRALSRPKAVGDPLLEGLSLFCLYAASFAFFTVSLEGPSYSLPFWMSLGLLYARARQLQSQQ